MNQGTKIALIIGGAVLGVLTIVPAVVGAFTGWQGYGWGMMGPGMMGGFGMGLVGPIFMVAFWVFVIWAVVALIRGGNWYGNPDYTVRQPDSALEVLKKRYARGEISKEEYEEKKRDLA